MSEIPPGEYTLSSTLNGKISGPGLECFGPSTLLLHDSASENVIKTRVSGEWLSQLDRGVKEEIMED